MGCDQCIYPVGSNTQDSTFPPPELPSCPCQSAQLLLISLTVGDEADLARVSHPWDVCQDVFLFCVVKGALSSEAWPSEHPGEFVLMVTRVPCVNTFPGMESQAPN